MGLLPRPLGMAPGDWSHQGRGCKRRVFSLADSTGVMAGTALLGRPVGIRGS